jgi:hypothetical protein
MLLASKVLIDASSFNIDTIEARYSKTRGHEDIDTQEGDNAQDQEDSDSHQDNNAQG